MLLAVTVDQEGEEGDCTNLVTEFLFQDTRFQDTQAGPQPPMSVPFEDVADSKDWVVSYIAWMHLYAYECLYKSLAIREAAFVII